MKQFAVIRDGGTNPKPKGERPMPPAPSKGVDFVKIGIIKTEETTRAVFGNKKLMLSMYSSNQEKVGEAFDIYIREMPNPKGKISKKQQKEYEKIKPAIILSFKNLDGVDSLLRDLQEIRMLLVAKEERQREWSEYENKGSM